MTGGPEGPDENWGHPARGGGGRPRDGRRPGGGGDPDLLATVGQRVVGFAADVALAGTVLVTPGMLLAGTLRPGDIGPGPGRVFAIAGFLFLAVYEVVPVALWGRTPGKAIVGTKIVRAADGGPPGWLAAVLRWALPAIAFQLSVVGWVVAFGLRAYLALDPLHRGAHDHLAGTLVVKVPAEDR
ncbi:MAG: RDD family protein [Actinomycetota bacterium]